MRNNTNTLKHLFAALLTIAALAAGHATAWATDKTLSGSESYTAQDGDVLTGSTSGTVTIASNASITLSDATITGGIVCDGSATISLVGTNSVSGATNKAGIQIGGSGTTLTIRGDGLLTVTGGDWGAGIGLSAVFNYDSNVSSGDIVIEGGTITTTGGKWGAGIGTGVVKNTNNNNSTSVQFGNITIKGGSVTAIGGDSGDGIGKGYAYSGPTITIGTVTICDGIDKVDASSIKDFASVVYKHVDGETETNVTASKTDYFTIIENGNRLIIVQKVTPTIADVPDQTYTGSAITPEPTVIAGSLSLTKGTDYVYSYTNNTNVGTAKVRATFQGNYASLGYVEKEFTILPSTVIVNVTGNGTVTYNDKSAASGETFGVAAEKGTDVTLTLTPENGYAVSIEYGYTNNSGTNASGFKLPVSGTTATLTVPNDLKDGTYVNLTVTFVSALVGGADEASAVALTDNTLTDLAGGWYKVDSDITFDHTLNLLGDTHLIIDDGKTMTVNTASNLGIDSDYTLTVSGAGALNVTTTSSGVAVRVGNYVQTGATVTASGNIGIRCTDDFIAFNFDNDFTFSGGQLTATGSGVGGIWADNDITLSCTNATDFIQASSYSSGYGAVKIAEGNALTDGTEASNGMNGYSGTLTNEQITAIGGKTLRRAVITSYVDASGTLHENVIAIPLDNTMTTLAAGWYVVNSDVTFTQTVTTTGDVTLILGDDCTMSFGTEVDLLDGKIIECNSHDLTIYGQSGGTGWLKAYSAQNNGIHVNNYTQYSGNVVICVVNGACIYANNSVALLGGTLDLKSEGEVNGEITGGSISILGGKLWARNKGLWSPQGITLGYTNATDQIYVKIYHADGMGLKIADGKTLVNDNGEIWSGALHNIQIEHGINDRTLKPLVYSGVTLTKDGSGNVSATFSGSSETTVSIPVDVNVNSVTYDRAFTEGRPATVMLPFSLSSGQTLTGGTLYKFSGVTKNETAGKWEATMTETATLQANTPYLLLPDENLVDGKVTFNLGSSWSTVTLNTTGGGYEVNSGGWKLVGSYAAKTWAAEDPEIGKAYFINDEGSLKKIEPGMVTLPTSCYLLREVESLTTTAATVLGENKYVTTFFNGTQDYRLLDGAKAYTVNLDGEKLVFHLIGVDGSVIPHGNAVVIVSESGSITLTKLASTDVIVYDGNILEGSDTDVAVSEGKVNGDTPYVLNISGGVLGFYKFVGDTIPAGKAYYLKSE